METNNDPTDELAPGGLPQVVYQDKGRSAFGPLKENHGAVTAETMMSLACRIPVKGGSESTPFSTPSLCALGPPAPYPPVGLLDRPPRLPARSPPSIRLHHPENPSPDLPQAPPPAHSPLPHRHHLPARRLSHRPQSSGRSPRRRCRRRAGAEASAAVRKHRCTGARVAGVTDPPPPGPSQIGCCGPEAPDRRLRSVTTGR